MNILATIVISFYLELIHILCRKDCEWQTLDDLIELVKKAAMDAARHSVEAMVCMMNEEFFKNAGIARQGWRRKEQTVKHLHTSIGDLALQRDTYQHRETRKCVALLFEALQITPHQRTSRELIYGVLETATGMSFRRAIDAVGAQICVQTAINWLRSKLPALERVLPDKLRAVKELHVFLDEDHLSMLKDKTRKHRVLPVGAVAEGRMEVCRSRYRLIHPFYFTSADMSAANLTETIAGYISSQYDTTVLTKIYVHGDGANWIGKALEDLGSVEYVMDEFHFSRELRRCCRRFERNNGPAQKKIKAAIMQNDPAAALAAVTAYAEKTADPKVMAKAEEFGKYLQKYWEPIVRRLTSCPQGSCTEALVQHIASERFSSTPHGWSVQTVTKLAALRTFLLNGGSLREPALGQPCGTYAKYIDEFIETMLAQSMDFSIFDAISVPQDGNSGTQHLLRIFERAGYIALGQ